MGFLYKICNIGLVNKIIYSYYIWVYTGFGILIIFLIRNQNINLKNIFINVGIVLTFLGTNYHGIKTGNVGYILGFLIAYFFSINSDKSNSKLSSIIMDFIDDKAVFILVWNIIHFYKAVKNQYKNFLQFKNIIFNFHFYTSKCCLL